MRGTRQFAQQWEIGKRGQPLLDVGLDGDAAGTQNEKEGKHGASAKDDYCP